MSIKTALFGVLQPDNLPRKDGRVTANAIVFSHGEGEGKQLRILIKGIDGDILTIPLEHVNVERLMA